MNKESLASGGGNCSVLPDRLLLHRAEVEPGSLEQAIESSGGYTATRVKLTDD